MIEVRFHGRGGQGSVIASSILAEAAFKEGKHVQSFPHFGVERRGAPVLAFTRIDDERIRIKHEIYTPDCIVVLEPALLEVVNIASGLKPEGMVLVNSDRDPKSFPYSGQYKVATVDAIHIAVANGLGTKASPIVNTAIMGAFARFTGIVSLDSILNAIEEKVPIKKKENQNAAKEAYEKVRIG